MNNSRGVGGTLMRVQWTPFAGRLAISICIVWLPGCEDKDSSRYRRQTRVLRSANVAADVNAAVAKGDSRFLSTMGFAQSWPGVPVDPAGQTLIKQFGWRFIDGSSDVVESDAHGEFKEVAAAYAEAYNTLLLSKLPVTRPAQRSAPSGSQ